MGGVGDRSWRLYRGGVKSVTTCAFTLLIGLQCKCGYTLTDGPHGHWCKPLNWHFSKGPHSCSFDNLAYYSTHAGLMGEHNAKIASSQQKKDFYYEKERYATVFKPFEDACLAQGGRIDWSTPQSSPGSGVRDMFVQFCFCKGHCWKAVRYQFTPDYRDYGHHNDPNPDTCIYGLGPNAHDGGGTWAEHNAVGCLDSFDKLTDNNHACGDNWECKSAYCASRVLWGDCQSQPVC